MGAYMLEFAFSVILLASAGFGIYILYRTSSKWLKLRDYVNTYKAERIYQIGKKKEMDIKEIIKEESLESRKEYWASLPLEYKLDYELSNELGEDFFLEDLDKSKDKKKK